MKYLIAFTIVGILIGAGLAVSPVPEDDAVQPAAAPTRTADTSPVGSWTTTTTPATYIVTGTAATSGTMCTIGTGPMSTATYTTLGSAQ
jgi:hypothetical protein